MKLSSDRKVWILYSKTLLWELVIDWHRQLGSRRTIDRYARTRPRKIRWNTNESGQPTSMMWYSKVVHSPREDLIDPRFVRNQLGSSYMAHNGSVDGWDQSREFQANYWQAYGLSMYCCYFDTVDRTFQHHKRVPGTGQSPTVDSGGACMVLDATEVYIYRRQGWGTAWIHSHDIEIARVFEYRKLT